MPDEIRRALNRALAAVRWTPVEGAAPSPTAPKEPYITHTGLMEIPGMEVVPCCKINTGETILDMETVQRLFGGNA